MLYQQGERTSESEITKRTEGRFLCKEDDNVKSVFVNSEIDTKYCSEYSINRRKASGNIGFILSIIW